MAEPIKLPVNEIPYKNSDEEALEAFGDVLVDGFVETIPDTGKKISRKRPGLGTAKLDLGTGEPVDGIYWWNGRKMVVAVSDGKVFKIENDGSGNLTATELSGETVNPDTKVTFAESGSALTGFKLTLASGKKIHYIEPIAVVGSDGLIYNCLATHTSSSSTKPITGVDYSDYWGPQSTVFDLWVTATVYDIGDNVVVEYLDDYKVYTCNTNHTASTEFSTDIANWDENTDYSAWQSGFYYDIETTLQEIDDEDAPQNCTHVAFLDDYILANKVGSGEFDYSAIGDNTDWGSLDFFTAQASPDDLITLLVSHREIYLLGEQTCEVWYNDGISPFSRITLIQYGTLSPYGACFDGGDLYFLNNLKQVMRLQNGRTPQILSTPYDKYIQTELTTVDDMFAYILTLEGKKWYVATFPTENQTLVYDIQENAWYEWGKYQTGEMEQRLYNRFIGNCYAYCPNWGMNLIGSRIDGKIFDMSFSNYDDDGDLIRFVKRTGNISHGTTLKKRSQQLLWRATSGKGRSDGSESYFGFRFRDDGRKVWSNERQVSLGAIGEYKNRKKYVRLGMYETRQYEIVHSDIAPFTLIEAEEIIEVLGR